MYVHSKWTQKKMSQNMITIGWWDTHVSYTSVCFQIAFIMTLYYFFNQKNNQLNRRNKSVIRTGQQKVDSSCNLLSRVESHRDFEPFQNS